MGGAVSCGVDHDDLTDKLKDADYIKTSTVELVFRAVDRGFYFLPDSIERAYKDLAWKNGNLHLSAPCIYGEVMESLELRPGLSFLNLGSGLGYLSTMVGLILGPYGINHGVELHGDVIEYAYTKLNEFKRVSPALDCFEFCEPVFVKGNSLCLSSDTRQYDRVYCGAACPENHENYMKNLLKVGGILVMPLNENLVQITRKTETSWESKTVLPVSFSRLQSPSPKDAAQIKLPEVGPVRLDEACRAVIRAVLRERAREEHPVLSVRTRVSRPSFRNRPASIRLFPNIIIPLVESSDEEASLEQASAAGIVISNRRFETTLVDLARSMSAESSLSFNRAVERNRSVKVRGASEATAPRPKREKFDSGVVLGESESDSSEGGCNGSGGGRSRRRAASTPSVSSDTDSESEGPPPPTTPLYSTVMREKVLALPLPHTLKSYLNYHREF